MTVLRRLRRHAANDEGFGIVTVIMLIAVLMALTVTGVTVAVNNMNNSRSDRQSLQALASSEAGVAQAIQFLRGGALSTLTCMEPAPGAAPGTSCQGTGPSWISATNPQQVNIDGTTGTCGVGGSTNCYKVWIGTITPYVPKCAARIADPSASCYGVYRIHSSGFVGSGPGARAVAVDVKVAPYPFPIGVFTESFSGNGNAGIHYESLFTNGCVTNRQDDSKSGSGFQFAWDSAAGRPVLDTVYDQPTGAHATGSISTSNTSCGFGSGGGPIHLNQVKKVITQVACNSTFKFDQDGDGGSLAASVCYGAYTKLNGAPYPTTSAFSPSDLQKYGYRPRGLSDAQYDALRTQAIAEGTYNIASGNLSSTLSGLYSAGITSPVLFWDNSAAVSLNVQDIPSQFKRVMNPSTCTIGSLTIVVLNGSLKMSGGNTSPYLVTSMFVPDGTLTGQGGYNAIGTVFANVIDLGGNPDYYMDSCFANNPPGGTLDVQVTNWHEADGKNIT